MEQPNPITMKAYGTTWRFTPGALVALKPFGMGAPATLTNLILQLWPPDGFREIDYYEVDYQGARLSIKVREGLIRVDALASPDS
jgi:hypothetical protein